MGNWRVGAIATLIDIIGSSVIVATVGNITVSVDFSISYFSPAKINEEIEIEAKVLGHKGTLSSNTVVIRKKENGELIAVGKQWMSAFDLKHKTLCIYLLVLPLRFSSNLGFHVAELELKMRPSLEHR